MFLLVTHEKHPWACRIFTLTVCLCLLTSSLGAVPVLLSMVVSESQSSAEELETESVVRCNCPSQMRLRFCSAKTVKSLRDSTALKGLSRSWQLPRPLLLPYLVGSGIRLRC